MYSNKYFKTFSILLIAILFIGCDQTQLTLVDGQNTGFDGDCAENCYNTSTYARFIHEDTDPGMFIEFIAPEEFNTTEFIVETTDPLIAPVPEAPMTPNPDSTEEFEHVETVTQTTEAQEEQPTEQEQTQQPAIQPDITAPVTTAPTTVVTTEAVPQPPVTRPNLPVTDPNNLRSPQINTNVNLQIKPISGLLLDQAKAASVSFLPQVQQSNKNLKNEKSKTYKLKDANYNHRMGYVNHSYDFQNLMNLFIQVANNPNLNLHQDFRTEVRYAQYHLYYLTSVKHNKNKDTDRTYLDFYSYLTEDFIDALIKIVQIDIDGEVFSQYGQFYDYAPIQAARVLTYVLSGLVSNEVLPTHSISGMYGVLEKKIYDLFNFIKTNHLNSEYYYAVVSGLRAIDLENGFTGADSQIYKYTNVEYDKVINKLKLDVFNTSITSVSDAVSHPVNFYCAQKDYQTYCNRYAALMRDIEYEFLNFPGIGYFAEEFDTKIANPNVYVFPSKREYDLYVCIIFESMCYLREEHTAELNASNGGFYDGVRNLAILFVDQQATTTQFTDSLFVHEMAHYLQNAYLTPQEIEMTYRNNFIGARRWLFEGLAEIFAIDFLYDLDRVDLPALLKKKLGILPLDRIKNLGTVIWSSLTNRNYFGNNTYSLSVTALDLMNDQGLYDRNAPCILSYDLTEASRVQRLGLQENILLRSILVTAKEDDSTRDYAPPVGDTSELGHPGSPFHDLLKCFKDDATFIQSFEQSVNLLITPEV